jgi:hypothetical protein
MTKTMVTLACCALVAPLAFAQSPKKTATEQPITVTGTLVKTTTEEGAAANYQPLKTLVVRQDRSNTAGTYVLNGPGHIMTRNGDLVQTAIKPGTRVRVYYVNTGDVRMVDHVVID